ncbi:hypothetical protein CYY_004628 [Polysphondylium violaceum]|uniref:Uncharacterized protein n=1 Tax=Polysphondylium violaceum TaxID=133409 RepID=A0A8J4PWK5_9MYCE|nr:hypothetical protein CYY_004628 [Polysphondylium violaceum]
MGKLVYSLLILFFVHVICASTLEESSENELVLNYIIQNGDCQAQAQPCDLCDQSKWTNNENFNKTASAYFIDGGKADTFFQMECTLHGDNIQISSTSQNGANLVVTGTMYLFGKKGVLLNTASIAMGGTGYLNATVIKTTDKTLLTLRNDAVLEVLQNIDLSFKGSTEVDLNDNSVLRCFGDAQFDLVKILGNGYLSGVNVTLDELALDPNAVIEANGTLEFENKPTSILLGRAVASTLLFHNNLSAYDLQVDHLTVPSGFSLTITSNGVLRAKSLQLNGNLVIDNANLIINADEMVILRPPGIINLVGNSMANFSNVAIRYLNTTSPDKNKPLSTINIDNSVSFIGSFDLDAVIILNPNSVLDLNNDLVLEKCIKNYGGIINAYQVLTCNNDDLYLYLTDNITPQLTIYEDASISLYMLYNYGGLITIKATNKLVGNVVSNGTISIGVDAYLFVTGFIDLIQGSTVIIQGIGYNTSRPALEALNPIKLAGDIYFNVSAPLPNANVAYFLVSSQQLYLEGKFENVIQNPLLAIYNLTQLYVYPVEDDHSVVPLPDTFLVYSNTYTAPTKKHGPGLGIFFGIFIPIVFVCAAIGGGLYLYKKRQSAQNIHYHRLNEASQTSLST